LRLFRGRRESKIAKQQHEFVKAFTEQLIYGPALMRALRHDIKALVYTRECFLAVLRLAFVEMSDGDCGDDDFPDVFTRACLSANSLLAAEITTTPPYNDARDLLPMEVRSIVGQLPKVHDEIGRTDAFIRWLATSDAVNSTKHLPIVEDFTAFTGLTPDEYAASAYAATARCTSLLRTWDAVQAHGVAFDLDTWLIGVKEQRCVRDFFRLNTVTFGRGPCNMARRAVIVARSGATTLVASHLGSRGWTVLRSVSTATDEQILEWFLLHTLRLLPYSTETR
jgi:hypothetical protein